MMKGEFAHHNHGDELHNIAIMMCKSICAERGYIFLDPGPFKMKAIYPGDPDVIVRIMHKGGGYSNHIIEVETHPTKASIALKTKQFSGDGFTDLHIIDLTKLTKKKDWRSVKLGEMWDFIGVWTP